jgi:hypothetical protein
MYFIVYITDECREEAKTHNFSPALESLCRDIEDKQSISMFQPFQVSFLVKKKFGTKQGRLIAAKEIIKVNDSEYAVIKLLSVLIRGSTDYTAFHENSRLNGEKYLRRTNTAVITQVVSQRIASDPLKRKKPLLSEDEQSFLYSSNSTYNLENQALIYESEDWIAAINQKPYINHMNRIYDTINELLSGKYAEDNYIEIKNQPDMKIVYFFDAGKKYIFLADLCNTQNTNNKLNEIIDNWNSQLQNTEISQLARRSYPQYLIADENLWSDLEKDSQSNFSLSGEEIKVLTSISEVKAFPLFINGRAGSGKSTILQYLFAEYFSRYLSYQESVQPPVYFTYNTELLKHAKKFVFGLLKINSNFTETREKFDDDDLNQRLDVSFNELQGYLLSLVDIEDIEIKFLPHNYVNYSKFTILWNERFRTDRAAMKEYSPDICWHIIRTYIEGIDPEDYLDPDDYAQLEKDQKTISQETYTKIYKTVWENWYHKIKMEKKLWDDQDLVRYIIEANLAKPQFSGIFCDEAQDFTRIEMEVIYRLSIFSDRDIPFQYVSRIPFAFAGDELQTLNPTGFRWDALTALFTEKFILSVYPDNAKVQATLNFRELKNNYRSSHTIVNFCNALQLFRAGRFGISGLLPQEPWKNAGGSYVAGFEPNSAIFWQGIKQKTDTVFIIPCNEGEELSWIKNDPDLSANIKIENDTPDIPVLSANLSKGLEFNRVVVWGFGNQPGLDKLINPPEYEDPAQRLPLEYHINKTYVAISRAKKKLYIVDTDEGIKKLWAATKNDGLINEYLSNINKTQKKWTLENLATYIEGSENDFLDNEEIDTEGDARQFMENGAASKSSILLRYAAGKYKNLQNNQLAAKCEGIADIFNNNYISAGNQFYKGGWIDMAVKSFWLGNKFNPDDITGFKKIIEIAKEKSRRSLYYKIALAITNPVRDTINNSIDSLKNEDADENFEAEGCFPVTLLYEVLHNSVNKIIDIILIKKYFNKNILDKLISVYNRKVINISTEKIAEMAFELNDYKTALDFWDRSPDLNEKNYKTALAQIKKFPENIKSLYELKEFDRIADQFLKFNGELTGDDLMMAVNSLFMRGRSEKAFRYIINFSDAVYFDSVLKECSDCLSVRDKKLLTLCYKIAQIANENWRQVLNIISNSKNNEINPMYIAAAIARTKGLHKQHPSVQKPISDYLEKEIIKKFNSITESLIFEAGTAIEKAGRRIDILKYYEYAMDRFKNNEEKMLICVERWINAKELQANFNNGSEKWIKERIQEARDKRHQYGIGDKVLDEFIEFTGWPEFYSFIINNEKGIILPAEKQGAAESPKAPVTNDSETVVSEKSKIEFDFEGYKFSYYKKNRRLNITNNEEGKTLTISPEKYSSDDYIFSDFTFSAIGPCKKVDDTPIVFKFSEDVITVVFDYSHIVFTFL